MTLALTHVQVAIGMYGLCAVVCAVVFAGGLVWLATGAQRGSTTIDRQNGRDYERDAMRDAMREQAEREEEASAP